MGSSVNGPGALSVVGLLVLGSWAVSPAAGTEPVMCPPVTIDDMFEEEEPEAAGTSTTIPPTTASTTTAPATTTSAPPQTITSAPPQTTTSAPPETTTTSSQAATTTTVPGTTTPSEATTTVPSTTTEPSTTTTPSISPSTTTAPPQTTTTTEPAEPPCDTPFVYPMVFPLMGAGDIGSPFGASRDGGARYHMGNDIAAPALQPVVAVADGTVTRVAGDTGISGYRIHVRHDDGWSSLYIHLNNDTAGTDDGNGLGIRPDLKEGDRIEAGQVIGWNGDSGNAESSEPHLHFELRDQSGDSIDPRASLQAAERVGEAEFVGPFADLTFDEGDLDPMILLLSRGMPAWCETGAAACPEEPAQAQEVSAWLASLIGLPASECGSDCGGVTEADLARAVAWDLLRDGYESPTWMEGDVPDSAWSTPPREPPARPDDLDVFEAHLILGGSSRCLSVPDLDRELTRQEAAEVLALYTGWSAVPHCPTNSTNR